ncbi:MAG TPA: response regulator [Puia sp.]|nr:response regulator [Puia sp.]
MKNIFLIDDDPVFVFLTRKMIRSMNFKAEINEISDGLMAISYLSENIDKPELLPDIIFLDLSMPVMDGWEFLNEYALLQPRLTKKIALFIVSSSISPHEVERSKTFQVVHDFLIKPLAKGKIREIIEEM